MRKITKKLIGLALILGLAACQTDYVLYCPDDNCSAAQSAASNPVGKNTAVMMEGAGLFPARSFR